MLDRDLNLEQALEPVFIGGCDRSGTTLVGSLLGRMSACVVVPEAQFVTECWQSLCRRTTWRTPELPALIGQHWRFKLWEMEFHPPSLDVPGNNVVYAEAIRQLISDFAARHAKTSHSMWVDHTPTNLRYALTLNTLFPNGKFVHIVRDGRAVAASVLRLDWGPNTIVRAARWWMEKMSFGLAAESALSPDRIMRVRFEDLVCQPQAELDRIRSFLGVDFEEPSATIGQSAIPAYTQSQHKLVGQSPVAARANAWRDDLSDREIEIFEHLSGDLLPLLGYQPVFGSKARGVGALELARQEILETLRRETVNRFRRVRRIRRHMKRA